MARNTPERREPTGGNKNALVHAARLASRTATCN